MPKLVVLLRVKDGGLFIDRWLECFGALADEIVAVDNGSQDGTLDALKNHPKVVDIQRTVGFDEGRDKNLLYDMARSRSADWMMDVDVDELFERRVTRETIERLIARPSVAKYRFRLFHFVDPAHYNADAYWLWYTARPARVMWRDSPQGHFSDIPFDNGSVLGVKGRTVYPHLRMMHFGSVYPEHLERKVAQYRELDPTREETYQRILKPGRRLARWREFDEAPFRVGSENVLLDVLMVTRSVFERFLRRLGGRRQ